MSEVLVREALVVEGLNKVLRQIANIDENVVTLEGRTQARFKELEKQLGQHMSEFEEFVRVDRMAKALQLAETRIVKVRQELETKYGFYDEVRRRATGMLQAVETQIVTVDTLRLFTEEVMLNAPGFWLAPALVSLASWFRDDRPVADRALAEALKRDGFKSSLFLALATRRMGRWAASGRWIQHYFLHQDPRALDREFVVLLDCVANGLFGADARELSGRLVMQWLGELEDAGSFVEKQIACWDRILLLQQGELTKNQYPLLRKHSDNWQATTTLLGQAAVHHRSESLFRGVMEAPTEVPTDLVKELDGIIHKLVSDFHEAELPLRRREREMQAVIDSEGDEKAAAAVVAAVAPTLEEHVPLTQLLTNAAAFKEETKATPATRKFAISLCREWIATAHDRFTARHRKEAGNHLFSISIDDWSDKTKNGEDQQRLETGLADHIMSKTNAEVAEVDSTSAQVMCFLGVVGLFGALMAFLASGPGIGGQVASNPKQAMQLGVVALVLGLALLVAGIIGIREKEARRRAIREDGKRRIVEARTLLRAIVAEIVDCSGALITLDGMAGRFQSYIRGLSPSQYAVGIGEQEGKTVVKGARQ